MTKGGVGRWRPIAEGGDFDRTFPVRHGRASTRPSMPEAETDLVLCRTPLIRRLIPSSLRDYGVTSPEKRQEAVASSFWRRLMSRPVREISPPGTFRLRADARPRIADAK